MIVPIEIQPKLVRVNLGIYGDSLNPTEITELLNLKPSKAHQKDENICTPPSKRVRKAGTGAWLLSSEGNVLTTDFEKHLSWLLNQLSGKELALERIRSLGCDTEVRCGWHASSDNTVPELSVELMARMVKLGLPIMFDIYFSGT